jgi:hypothetical protein
MHNFWVALPIIAVVVALKLGVYYYGQKKRDEGRAGFWTRSIFGTKR